MLGQGKDIREAPLFGGAIGIPQRLNQGGNLTGVHDLCRTFATVEQQVLALFMIHAPPPQVKTDPPRGEVNKVSMSFGSGEPSERTR